MLIQIAENACAQSIQSLVIALEARGVGFGRKKEDGSLFLIPSRSLQGSEVQAIVSFDAVESFVE